MDSLCERYHIDNSARTLHGALLDAQLLAEVYLAMTHGQESLIMEEATLHITITPTRVSQPTVAPIVLFATAEEVIAHEMELGDIAKGLGGVSVWHSLRASEQRAIAPA